MNLNYSQKDMERGYLVGRRLTPSSFFELGNAIDVPKLLNHLGLLRGHKTQYINGRKQYYILCPFHQERTPSCGVDTKKKFFYCWGCHQKGDLVKFTALIQGKGSLHAMGTLRNLFRVKGLEYEKVETPIPEVLDIAKSLVNHMLSHASNYKPVDYETGTRGISLQEHVEELRKSGIIDGYLHDFLIHNKLRQLYTISQFARDIKGVPSEQRDYRGDVLSREFLEYVDERRSGQAWEDFLFENYDERDETDFEYVIQT